jgi:hypothetical protein
MKNSVDAAALAAKFESQGYHGLAEYVTRLAASAKKGRLLDEQGTSSIENADMRTHLPVLHGSARSTEPETSGNHHPPATHGSRMVESRQQA